MHVKLKRYEGNPILRPRSASTWESKVVTNPGAWYDEKNKEVLLLYRAASDEAKHHVYLGLAKSKDGFTFERDSDDAALKPSEDGFDAGCIEDPRIVKFDNFYFVTYAARPFPPGHYWQPKSKRIYKPKKCPESFPAVLRNNSTSTGLAITKDFKNWIRAGRMTDPRYDDRNVIIFPEKVNGKFVTLHRPMEWCGEKYGTKHPAIWIATCDDLLDPKNLKLLTTAKYDWEDKIGGATPPLKTDKGWLTLYHAVGADKHYRIGAMLLDLDNPSNVLCRTRDWIYQPEEKWETEGLYNGVVFPCGNVILGDTLHVYYGGGDVYCGVATCKMDELMDYLLSCPGE